MTTLPRVIPLFPLPNVVLFPRMPMPLHVFEPRYREMVADVLEAEPKLIGITLLQPGFEADYYGAPPIFPVGCAGILERCDPVERGRYNILLRGLCRFRVVEEHSGAPYRTAAVEALEDPLLQPDAIARVRSRLTAAIGQASDGPSVLVLQTDLPHDVFVNALCQSLPLTPLERQSLLDCDAIAARYERLLEILEFKRLEQTYGPRGGDKVH